MQFPSSLPSVQTCCAVSPDSAHFLGGSSGSNSLGAELTLWDRRNEKRFIREFKGHSESVQDCMFVSVEVEKAEPNWYDNSDADVVAVCIEGSLTLHSLGCAQLEAILM